MIPDAVKTNYVLCRRKSRIFSVFVQNIKNFLYKPAGGIYIHNFYTLL